MTKNMHYSLYKTIPKDNPRQELWKNQRRFRGFDDTELWNLDFTIARFVAPRLKAFKEILHGYPPSLTFEEWKATLDKMILAFDLLTDENENFPESTENTKRETIEEGLDLFREYFFHLWD